MRIALLVEDAGRRRWHRWLADDLAEAGHDVILLHPDGSPRDIPAALQLALWLDRIYYRLHGDHAFDPLPATDGLPTGRAGESSSIDILVDCSAGTQPPPAATRVLKLSFDGETSELGALAALLGTGPQTLRLDDSAAAHPELARPAIARRDCLTEALDSMFSCVTELIVSRIARPRASAAIDPPRLPANISAAAHPRLETHRDAARAASGHLRKLVAAKLSNYLTRKATRPRKWSLALRRCAGTGLVDGPWPSAAAYAVVPDDGHRFYADPFLFKQDARTFLFCEEYPFATRRGIISVAEVDADGRVGDLRPVLERPYHLSYPFVFAHEGAIWMMPETAEANRVELYRALEFPYRWELDRTILDRVPGCDATLMDHAGACWMFLTASRHGSTWDKLRIYSASSPLGPWREHDGGLITIDSTLARPGGAILRRNGAILRPAQDCSRFYGGGMTLLRLDALSQHEYREQAVAAISVTSRDNRTGTHSYSRIDGLEAIDIWGDFAGCPSVTLACTPISDGGDKTSPRASAPPAVDAKTTDAPERAPAGERLPASD